MKILAASMLVLLVLAAPGASAHCTVDPECRPGDVVCEAALEPALELALHVVDVVICHTP